MNTPVAKQYVTSSSFFPNTQEDALSQGMFQTLPSVPKKPDLRPDSDDMPKFQTFHQDRSWSDFKGGSWCLSHENSMGYVRHHGQILVFIDGKDCRAPRSTWLLR